MTPRRPSDLQGLIEDITVDCNDDDEELMGFENAFDEQADFPCPGTVIGQDVTVISVATKMDGANCSPLANTTDIGMNSHYSTSTSTPTPLPSASSPPTATGQAAANPSNT